MVSIYFDKYKYRVGETATITYVDALPNSLAVVKRGVIIDEKVLPSGGSGSFDYTVPTTLGTYRLELIYEGRLRAHDTMRVVRGEVPPKKTVTFTSVPIDSSVTVTKK